MQAEEIRVNLQLKPLAAYRVNIDSPSVYVESGIDLTSNPSAHSMAPIRFSDRARKVSYSKSPGKQLGILLPDVPPLDAGWPI